MLVDLYPRDHRRFSSLPLLGAHVDDFVGWLCDEGYPRLPIYRRVQQLPRVERALHRRGVRRVRGISAALIVGLAPKDSRNDIYFTATARSLARFFFPIVHRLQTTQARTAFGLTVGGAVLPQCLRVADERCGCEPSGGAAYVFPDHARMTSRDAEERERGALGRPPILLPVPQCVHTDPERVGELRLAQADEAPQGSHVPRFELAAHDAFALASAKRTGEVRSGEFTGVLHASFSMYST